MTDNVALTRRDKEELLKFLESYSRKITNKDIDEIENKLDKKIRKLKGKKLPYFAIKMLSQLKDLILVFNFPELPSYKRNHVIAALHYFIWSEDKIPDYIPVVGYLDDAFIVAVVHHRVTRDIEQAKMAAKKE